MLRQPTSEEIFYTRFEGICKQAEVICDCQRIRTFPDIHLPVIRRCLVAGVEISAGELYQALLELKSSIEIVVDEYRDFHKLGS